MSKNLNSHNIESGTNNNKQYASISFEQRIKFLKDVLRSKIPIRQAAIANSIKLSTAKVILKLYKEEGRVGKISVPSYKENDNEIKEEDQSIYRQQQQQNNELNQYHFLVCVELSQKLNYYKQINSQLEKELNYLSSYPYQQTNNSNYIQK